MSDLVKMSNEGLQFARNIFVKSVFIGHLLWSPAKSVKPSDLLESQKDSSFRKSSSNAMQEIVQRCGSIVH